MVTKRNGEIDTLRLVFAIAIVIFHFNDLYDYEVFSNGNICVEFFFIVSGFLIAKQIEKMQPTNTLSGKEIANTTWQLTYRKIKGLYPYFFSVLILQIIIRHIVIGHMKVEEVFMGMLRMLPNFTLSFMGLIPESDVTFYVGNTWFISALLISVLIIYPLLLRSYDVFSKIVFPLAAMFMLGYLYAENNGVITVWKGWTGFCYDGVLRALAELCLGISLCPLSKLLLKHFSWVVESRRIFIKLPLTALKIFIYSVVLLFAYGYDTGQKFSMFALLFLAVGVLMSFTNIGYCIPSCKFTRYLGKISLPIFIYHGFIRWTFSDLYTENEVTVKMFVLMVCGTIVASVILMYITDYSFKLLKLMMKKIKKAA